MAAKEGILAFHQPGNAGMAVAGGAKHARGQMLEVILVDI